MDLEEAAQELPIVGNESNGRIYKEAAYHLLAEVYISLGMETVDASFYGMAVDAASTIINGEVGDYQLITERFGDLSREGDVFSDIFWTNQQNRSSGNVVRSRFLRYNPTSGETIQPHNELWHNPQSFIDENTEAVIEQNPGY